MRVLICVAVLGASVSVAEAGQARTPAPGSGLKPVPMSAAVERQAQAYDAFINAKHLEKQNQIEAAAAAYKKAMELDPTAADIPASLADMFMRRERLDEAETYAQQAVTIAPTNHDGHRVLGIVYAMRAENEQRGPQKPAAELQRNAKLAIGHFEQALDKAVGETDPNMRATLSRLYLQTGEYNKAIPLLSDLVLQEPGWGEGPSLLAAAYSGAGRNADAIRWLEDAAPDDPGLYGTLADFYERERRLGDAVRAYEAGVRRLPRNLELKSRYAAALLAMPGKPDAEKARAVLNEILAVRANDARALYQLAQAQRRLDDLVGAETTARRLIAQAAKSPWGYYALAETLEERRQYQGVIEALEPAVAAFRKANPDGQELSLLLPHLGFAYSETGAAAKAVSAFKDAHRLAPTDGAVTAYLAQAYISAKQYTEAVALIRQARTQRPDDGRLPRLEAQALARSGKLSEGVAVMNALMASHPGDTGLIVTLSQLYLDANRSAEAVALLQPAQKQSPDDRGLAFQLGVAFDKARRPADAEMVFKAMLAKEPENAAVLNYLGYMLADGGKRLDESVSLLKRAVTLDPDNGSYLDSLGWAYFKSSKLELAEPNLKRAAEQLVANSVVQDHYGELLFKKGRYDEAIAAWTRALDGDNESIERPAIEKKIQTARQKLGRK